MNKEITGIMVYYYHVCIRKLWYFSHNITMEHGSENVKIGKVLDEQTYKDDDKHINIRDVINIDFIRERNIVHEVKKSRAIEQASIEQIKFYIWYLNTNGIDSIKGELDYPLLRRKLDVELKEEDKTRIETELEDIRNIINEEAPRNIDKMKICKKCAYHDLCFI